MSRFLLLAAASLLGAGCATPPPATTGAVAAAPVVQNCVRETPIGSSVPVTRCRTAEELQRDAQVKQAVEDAISRNRSGPSGGVPRN